METKKKRGGRRYTERIADRIKIEIPDPFRPLVGVKEVAEYMRVSKTYVYRIIPDAFRCGFAWRTGDSVQSPYCITPLLLNCYMVRRNLEAICNSSKEENNDENTTPTCVKQ